MLRLLLAAILLAAAASARAETRAIIFASDYTAAKPSLRLENTKVDARLIARTLTEAGVTDVKLVLEPSMQDWETELRALIARTTQADTVLVYYAGHGLQVAGSNYFVASDGETLVGMDPVLTLLASKAAGTVMIVDACRNNPYKADSQVVFKIDPTMGTTRSLPQLSMDQVANSGKGLAQIAELRGMSAMVLFSTEPGNVAADGEPGQGSPFAKVVARELKRRVPLNTAMRRISVAVNKETNGEQTPWRQGDLPFDVYVAGMDNFPPP